jgi:hypothetical protein
VPAPSRGKLADEDGQDLPVVLLCGAGLVVGLLAVGFRAVTSPAGGPGAVLGESALPQVIAETSAGVLALLLVVKGAAYALSLGAGFRGGPTFPAVTLGAVTGVLASIVLPGLDLTPAVIAGVAAAASAALGLSFLRGAAGRAAGRLGRLRDHPDRGDRLGDRLAGGHRPATARGPALMVPRRLVVRALLRASGTATALLVLYFTLPITGSIDRSTALLLVLGLLAFAGVVTWQVRAVLRSPNPGLRAIESLATAIPLFLVLFAAIYLRIADLDGTRSASR